MAENTIRVIFQGVDRLSGTLKKSTGSLSDFAKNVGLAMAAVGGLGLAAEKVWSVAKEGASMMRLQTASTALAQSFGQNMNSIVAAMRKASNETIDDMTLMSAASRALQLGVATTPEQFEKLTTASIALGRAMGRGPAEAIDDIVTGVGRMSPLILDNLGILTKGGAVYEDYAAQLGKTVDSLTEAEKKQALLNATMESAKPLLDSAGGLALDAASKYEQLDVKLKNLTNTLKMLAGEAIYDNINTTERLNEVLRQTGEYGEIGFFEWRKRWWEMHDAIKMSETAVNTTRSRVGDLTTALRSIPTSVNTNTNLTLMVNGDEVDVETFMRLTTRGGQALSRNLRYADEALGVAGLAGQSHQGNRGGTAPITFDAVLRGVQE